MTSPTRVLFVDYSGAVFGTEILMQRLAPAIADAGFEPVLLGPDGVAAEEWRALGFDHLRLDVELSEGIRRTDGSRPGPRELLAEVGRTRRNARTLAEIFRASGLGVFVATDALHRLLRAGLVGELERVRSSLNALLNLSRPTEALERRLSGSAVDLRDCAL